MLRKILVVDDSPVIRKMIIREIEALYGQTFQLRIFEANDGIEALYKLAKDKPDLILLDMHMPGLMGFEVLQKMRQLGVYTPTIVVSSEATRNDVIKAVQAGANDYLIKPFCRDHLEAKTRVHLQGAEPRVFTR